MGLALKRSFVGSGLMVLAAPGILSEHVATWAIIGAGVLAGVIASVVVRRD